MTEHGKVHQITYFVNGEEQHTTVNQLTVKFILESAGFTPASDYDLEDNNTHKIDSDANEIIHVHEKQSFTATYKGVTPTS